MTKYIIANWKMVNISDEEQLLKNISDYITNNISLFINENNIILKRIIICPSYTSIATISSIIENNYPKLLKNNILNIGAQNCSAYNSGAYTGEISAEMLKKYNLNHIIIGHSERRIYQKENNDILQLKIKQANSNNFSIIFCIGETTIEKNTGKITEALEEQLKVLRNYNFNQELLIAYEPVWAIGSAKIPTIEDIENASHIIKNYLEKNKIKSNYKILYGGSVNSENAAKIINSSNIDGILVGSASVSSDKLLAILANI